MTAPTIPAESRLMSPPTPVVELLPTDTCDHRLCGPGVAANTAILLGRGTLTFCNHHYNEFAASLSPFIRAIKQNEVS